MKYDVVTAVHQGKRDYQEDAVAANFAIGADHGFAVLADGMGGHAAGDVASKIVVTEVFAELTFQMSQPTILEATFGSTMKRCLSSANACIAAHLEQEPSHKGMGATLVAPVVFGERLYWISVGDSPLYLIQKGRLKVLNSDHSMAPQIDLMVERGLLDKEEGRCHPDRSCLTSVVMGRDIALVDCMDAPTHLRDGDVVIAASDGLQYLEADQIEEIVAGVSGPSSDIARGLMEALEELDDPDQDNISMAVIKCMAA